MIRFTCACGKTLSIKDELAGRRVKCPGCDATLDIPADAAQPAGPQASTCTACGHSVRADTAVCTTCGWNILSEARCCPKCSSGMTLQYSGEKFAVAIASAGALLALVVGFIIGPFLAFGLAAAMVAMGAFLLASGVRFECALCDGTVARAYLTSEERREMLSRRFKPLAGGGALCFVALGCVGLWALVGAREKEASRDQLARGSQSPTPARFGRPSTSAAAPDSPIATKVLANVDNPSPDEWQISVDGNPLGVVKPWSVYVFTTPPGKHEIHVMRGATEVVRVTAELTPGVNIFSPGAKTAYLIEERDYTGQSGFSEKGARFFRVTNAGFFTADYGLPDPFPETMIMERGVASIKKSKARRAMPAALTARDAAAYLLAPANVYVTREGDPAAAISVLTAGGQDDETVRILSDCLDSTVPDIVRACAKGLEPSAAKVPDDRLESWLTPLAVKEQPQTIDRIRAAVRLCTLSGRGRLLAAAMDRIPNDNRLVVLESVAAGDPDVRGAVVRAAFKTMNVVKSDPAGDAVMLKAKNIVDIDDFRIDDGLSMQIDALIAKLPAEGLKKGWDAWWSSKVGRRATDLTAETLRLRMAALVSQDAHGRDVVFAGLKSGHHRTLLQAFRLSQDAANRGSIEHSMRLAIGRLPAAECLDVLLMIVAEGPTQGMVSDALKNALKDEAARAARVAEISKRFASIAASENRAWILREIRSALPEHKREDTTDLLAGLCSQGFQDPDAAVRAGTVKCLVSTRLMPTPQSEKFWKMILEEPDPKVREPLVEDFALWMEASIEMRPPYATDAIKSLRAGPIAKIIASVGDAAVRSKLEQHADHEVQKILRGARSDKGPAGLANARDGLKEKDSALRWMAFDALADIYRRAKDRSILSTLQGAHAAEKDPGTKTRMDNELKGLLK